MYRLNQKEFFYDYTDGQAIIINTMNGLYYSLSMLGSEVMDQLLRGFNLGALADSLKEIEGCPKDIQIHLEQLVKDLMIKNILIPAEGTENERIEGTKNHRIELKRSFLEEGFVLELKEFEDMKTLILADNVYELEPKTRLPKLKEE